MQPSSLIFLVIIAIWSAYLLQHWVRRREHLATARSVDRFSDAMRVLERRAPLPELDLSARRPRSYAVSPARPSRQEVVVKRAESPTRDAAMRDAAKRDTPDPSVAPVRPTRVFHVLAGVSPRRVRGLSLLASLSLTLLVSPLVAFSALPWWCVLAVVAVLVADVAWLRRVGLSERAAARENALARGSGASPARSADRYAVQRESGAEPRFQAEPESRSEVEVEVEMAAQAVGTSEGSEGVDAGEPSEEADLGEPFADADLARWAEADPSGWAPVPVPPPTYTLKAKAERPMPIPFFVEDTEYAPVQPLSPDGLDYEDEFDGVVERRRAAGA